ncbi:MULTISPECIES: hypothetical protein [Streptomyces]|uniref:hypothetical protein n=1 Tax=Streptomyces TaxID=1883 RepID=UPI0004CC9F5F|nr:MULTISPECIES: hypothetical protein [Streptomyces]KOT64388.1 hypothetical protein ADK43_06085 [Streptomyces rimosus subsp. rimosus]
MPITSLWATPVHVSTLGVETARRIAVTPDLLCDVLPQAHPGHRHIWSGRTEAWPGGYHAVWRHGTGAWCALLVLDSEGNASRPVSGAIVLHDPRAGAANVSLPGLPWGRPLTLASRPGLLVVAPGWLGWQIAPVRTGEHRTVWTADTA